ncbi:hypothetical protein RI129_002515 [Pyrocoelia pectoralis]|uniref:Transmembrane protein n=1 Tax=Pyrocoelia pectoralis TaxID=417401 RepID=A0AAN7VMY6_9COLE
MSQNQQEEIELSNNQLADTLVISKSSKSSYYDRKKQQSKLIRVLTVVAYILSVSLVAIILSVYYIFMWEGKPSQSQQGYLRTGSFGENENNGKTVPKSLETNVFNGIDSASLIIDTVGEIQTDNSTIKSDNVTSSYSDTMETTRKENISNEVSQGVERRLHLEETTYVTTPSEENSTWSPEELNDFDGDYNEFQTEPIFIKRLFGYHKARIK